MFCLLLSCFVIPHIVASSSSAAASGQGDLTEEKYVKARRTNSLLDAFMTGRLQAREVEMKMAHEESAASVSGVEQKKKAEKLVVYSDHVDPSKKYENSLEDVHGALEDLHNTATNIVAPLPFQSTVRQLREKNEKVAYLRNLGEDEKIHLQMLRLYRFLSPDASNAKNRLSFRQAFKAGDVKAINTVWAKPSNLGEVVSLDQSIQGMVVSIEQGEEVHNDLLHNPPACVIG